MPKVLFRMAFVQSIQGNDDVSFDYLKKLVTKYPDDALTIPAYLRMGEHWLLLRKYSEAIKYYEKIPADYGGVEAGLALYHKAECYYNMADFEKAAKVYYEYVVKAEKGIIKADLKDEAMEFMAACWADMENGVDVAHKFLRKKGHPWEKDLYFQMGEKNLAHDRLEEARKAFRFLLELDPNYAKAPIADMAIVQTLEIEKRPDEAQDARVSLIGRYRAGSEWERLNSANSGQMAEAKKAVKKAMFQIPIYYHVKGSKDKKNPNLELLNQAEQNYQKYLVEYGESTWEVYEVHQNLGSVYSLLKQYSKAAREYHWCEQAPTDKFGKLPGEKRKTILTRADAAYNRVYMLDLDREKALKSVGGDKVKGYTLPQTQAYFKGVESYMASFGKSNSAPDVAYNAALVHYEAKNYSQAVSSLQKLLSNFPNHKHSNLIRRMLGQSLLEDGKYAESEKVFNDLLGRTSKSDKDYKEIQLSVASAIFKQADEKKTSGDNAGSALQYLKVVKSFPKADIADKALFEAGIQFEEANDVPNATHTFLRIHKEYPKSELKIKSVLRAASVYNKKEDYKSAAKTFLIVRDRFPNDSAAFNAIGWAAEAYEKVPDKVMAARTYESANEKFPKHIKTPSFIYNAGQTYEETKDYGNAVRVYGILGNKYSKSNFAVEAMF
ncbi:tetratricopeptide repeat protein, partial [Fibrobacterota bacterium]